CVERLPYPTRPALRAAIRSSRQHCRNGGVQVGEVVRLSPPWRAGAGTRLRVVLVERFHRYAAAERRLRARDGEPVLATCRIPDLQKHWAGWSSGRDL